MTFAGSYSSASSLPELDSISNISSPMSHSMTPHSLSPNSSYHSLQQNYQSFDSSSCDDDHHESMPVKNSMIIKSEMDETTVKLTRPPALTHAHSLPSFSYSHSLENPVDSRPPGLTARGKPRKPRSRRIPLSAHQRAVLEDFFNSNHYPTREEKIELGATIDLSGDKVHKWYDNRRLKNSRLSKRDRSFSAGGDEKPNKKFQNACKDEYDHENAIPLPEPLMNVNNTAEFADEELVKQQLQLFQPFAECLPTHFHSNLMSQQQDQYAHVPRPMLPRHVPLMHSVSAPQSEEGYSEMVFNHGIRAPPYSDIDSMRLNVPPSSDNVYGVQHSLPGCQPYNHPIMVQQVLHNPSRVYYPRSSQVYVYEDPYNYNENSQYAGNSQYGRRFNRPALSHSHSVPYMCNHFSNDHPSIVY